jgi:hypothetical protein
MQTNKRFNNPTLLVLLQMLGALSVTGFLYCLIILLHGVGTGAQADIVLYLVWFAVSVLSVYVMRRGDVWGAYALAIATILVGLYDITRNMATIGGASLGVMVMLLVLDYVYTMKKTSRIQVQPENI